VLVEDLVGSKRVELAGTEPVDCAAHMFDELSQAGLVIRRHGFSRSLSLRLGGHIEASATNWLRQIPVVRIRRAGRIIGVSDDLGGVA
jgi:hypothetical protein